MSTDPYQILGVAKTASKDEIRKAYRALAKKHHPDLNPGDKKAEEQFKLVSMANDILSDSEKRARYDRGEIDIHGQEQGFRGGAGYRQYADGQQGFRYSPGGGQFSEDDLHDIFGMFGGGAGRYQSRPQRGQDRRYNLTIAFLESINGTTSRVTLPVGGALDVKIPPGMKDGGILRLRGKGEAGVNGGPAGDALITIHVREHDQFKRDGQDLRLIWPIDLKTAILGGKITVPTPQGDVALNVPAHSDSGNVLRLKGRGVPANSGKEVGNLFVTLQIKLGDVDPALEEFIKTLPNN